MRGVLVNASTLTTDDASARSDSWSDSWLRRALLRRIAEGVTDPEAAVAGFNSSI